MCDFPCLCLSLHCCVSKPVPQQFCLGDWIEGCLSWFLCVAGSLGTNLACVCLCAGLSWACACCSVNLSKSARVLESVCWPHFFVHLSVGLSFPVCECLCACCVLCFNSGGQAAANSSHEGAPRGAFRRIWRLMVSLEHSSTHYQLGRSSCLSPGAACQVPCPLPYS